VRRSLVAVLALTGAMACQSSLSSRGNVDGTWEWELNRNPSGSSITLSLVTNGETVTGSGTICGVGPACSPGPVTITGQHAGQAFELTLRDSTALTATYSGELVSSDQLRGTWRHGSDSATVILNRN
jgi:hypothetical protein